MIQKPTTTDTILDEIHRTRREISERFGGDLRAILDDARKRQDAPARPVRAPGAASNALHPSGEVGRFEVDDQPSPPADR
jgi:hypothetical protein